MDECSWHALLVMMILEADGDVDVCVLFGSYSLLLVSNVLVVDMP